MKKELRQTLQVNREQLEASKKDLKAIFEIMFRVQDRVLCETNDGFRIKTYTYGEIYERICRTAEALYAKVGATHQYIALEMENSPDWITAFWAILKSGNKPYLVNMRYPESLTQGILKTLQVKYILCAEKSALTGEVITMTELSGDYPAVCGDVFENELAFSSSATSMNEVICFYSGLQIAEQILNFKSIVKECPQIAGHYKGQLKQLAFLPFYHVFGLFAVYFWFTFFGRTLVFLRDYSAETILKTCRRHQVTHIFAVPMLWHTVEKQVRAEVAKQGEKKEAKLRRGLALATALQNRFPNFGAKLAKRLLRQVTDKLFGRSVLFCISGGSYLRDSAMELLNGIGYNMHNGYGMSEIGITSVELRSRPKDKNRNSIGKPFDAVSYRLDDEGILQVKGGSLCIKKLVNGKAVSVEDWFDTGDRMECVDGYYYIRGRRSDTVIGENGENINPDMIEKAFMPQSVQQFCVLGMPGENGQELSLVAQVNPYTTKALAKQIKDYFYGVNDTFPAATAVKNFYFTFDELAPPTAVKVSRTQLLEKIKNGLVTLTPFNQFQVGQAGEEQGSVLLGQVCRIIAGVLEIDGEKVSGESHIFYDLGATSIQYFSILTALAEEFSIDDYDNGDTYRYTPKEICEYIESKL
ncbi:MAG: AMP-binding protein [Oscillospiraceae bacterium]|nr:AMP-binding protein [Oscillospiraceae bacterium]